MPAITLTDVSLGDCRLSPQVADLRRSYFQAVPEVCIERARLVTQYSLEHGLFRFEPISVLEKARLYRWVLEQRQPVVRHRRGYDAGMRPFSIVDTSPFAGSTTSKFKGVPLYPEFLALTLWPELHSLPRRPQNPYQLSEDDVAKLNGDVFPHWLDYTITEIARRRCHSDNLARLGVGNHAPELKLLSRLVFFLVSKPGCISHTIPDFSQAVGRGLRAVIDEAARRGIQSVEPRQLRFYAAVGEVLEGIIAYAHKLAAEAERLAAASADPSERQELLELASIHRRVPEHAAQTFREGLTTVWICWTALHLENPNIGLSLGRLDQLLYPLYRQDVAAGRLDPQQAVDLLSHLWLKIGDHVPAVPESAEQLFGGTGSNQAITLGGIDRDGHDAVNDLTYVMLRATELMKLRDPNLNARYHPGVNSSAYLRRLCQVNLTTGATPAIHNDRAVIKALMSAGDTCDQARDYGVIGCVEPASNGRAYTASASVFLNLASALELALYNGRHRLVGLDTAIGPPSGDPCEFDSFARFKEAVRTQIVWLAEQATRLNDILGRVHQDFYPTPILSALMEGPMAKGLDVIEGGAEINASGVTVIGLADVADSLSAIQRLVYEERAVSFPDLLRAINRDFAGDEALRLRLVNPEKTPKYGNDDPMADTNVAWMLETIHEVFSRHVNYRGGRFRVGYWTMTNHAGFGRLMPALPSGRRAHENLSSGVTPVSGMTPRLTPMLNAVAVLPVAYLANGMALNLKYTPAPGDSQKMLDDFVASVEAYFDSDGERRDGGMEIQFNVTSRETFVDAVAHPENHPELLVRVSGYTAYFKDLNPQMQKEIIDRTEYLLTNGEARPFAPFTITAGSA